MSWNPTQNPECPASDTNSIETLIIPRKLPAPSGQTFAVVADDPAMAGGIEFSQYAKLVEERLATQGYTPVADPEKAQLLVRFDFGVENLFDKFYYLPLGGAYLGQGTTMRLPASGGTPYGVAVPGAGRSIYAGINYKF